jgi:Arylsulfotransferase (ASST).
VSKLRTVALLLACVLVAAGCDWLEFGGTAGRTGAQFEPSFNSTSVPALQASRLASLPITGQAVVYKGLVLAAGDGTLTEFDAATYGVVWTAPLPSGSTVGNVPAIDPGSNTVFVTVSTATNPVLLGFDVDGDRNCNPLLNSCLPIFRSQLGSVSGPATPPAVDGGRVFANGASGLYAFDSAGQTNCVPSTGTQECTPLWSATTGFAAPGIGPAAADGVVHDAVTGGVRALNAINGAVLWTDAVAAPVSATPSVAYTRTLVPAGSGIEVFARDGCGSATCTSAYTFAAKQGDPAGAFLGTPTSEGAQVLATNANGSLYAWSGGGCGTASCQPSLATAVNTPTGGSTTYSQSVALGNGTLFVLGRQSNGGADHMTLTARSAADLHQLQAWDLGVGDFAPGLASPSVTFGVVYTPIGGSLFAVHPPPVQPLASMSVSPLTLTPAFSSTIFDYTIRCATGTNAVTIDATAVPGGTVRLVSPITTQPTASQSNPVNLAENQAAVVEATNAQGQAAQYWVRCLPHDFPTLNVTPHPAAGTPTPGWYVTANLRDAQSYAMILDTNGTPVWYKHAPVGSALDVKPFGHNRVAFASAVASGFGKTPGAHYDVYNLENNQIAEQISAVDSPTDFHDMIALPNGNRMVLTYAVKHGFDLTGLNVTPTPGPNSAIADCEIQEVNPQGQLVWKWDGSDHVDPVSEAEFTGVDTINNESVYDVYHCNSIDAIPGGDVLVSIRHMSAVIRIRRSDGKILWKLGGTANNKDNAQHLAIQNYPQTATSLQHDARYLPNGDISVFDNQSLRSGPAQGVEFALDLANGTAHPVFQFGSPENKQSFATGNFRRYTDGHSVVCWGITAFGTPVLMLFSEVDASGNDVLDVGFGTGDAPYRAIKAPPPRFDINVLRADAGRP